MTTFQDSIKDFHPISADEAQATIASGKDFVLFVGRETCPYCQRFAPKLAKVSQEHDISVAFLDSQNVVDQSAIQVFRDNYGIKTVPGLLVAKEGKVRVVCDSSLSLEEIVAFID